MYKLDFKTNLASKNLAGILYALVAVAFVFNPLPLFVEQSDLTGLIIEDLMDVRHHNTVDDFAANSIVSIIPESQEAYFYSIFSQDGILPVQKCLRVTMGSKSEKRTACELGYCFVTNPAFFLDLSAFFNDYWKVVL
ncbi:hypothetical protein HRM2_43280 [Desulforapulum autotrophicum HRM2]|uniref:Uncharacterized protein n=1 Tax=Desulforapulum autotrophicum (strain ATCC 43914 / DSM 3382 / VKM B-1955 / HRM2) TaxID=177437 RepID=C0QDW3_DESAH|nr:hypothetical protein [Desulforapulum autotrophicum]ACN17384.1 hypothetical protein HRM2_43280 [Desulforapulum autotrophicum HRM2]